MNHFILGDRANKDKVFFIRRVEVERRLDPFYYIPSIAKLEQAVQKYNPQPLSNYVVAIASGATPKTSESEKYYTNQEEGVPFLRVQNLSPKGHLQLEDCKYINQATHEGMLKRSQVGEGDLLVKITGVGRMAVASVAPKGFEGNTNQHMVVIKTQSKQVSEVLAAYLNTNIGERLASRRATGGTRPALDYPALLSIPIIFNEHILSITQEAVQLKQTKLDQAQQLLASINGYLLKELGIVLQVKDTSLQNRIFDIPMRETSGGRFDPFYLKYVSEKNESSLYEEVSLVELASIEKGQSITSKDVVAGNYAVIAGGKISPYSHYAFNQSGNVITVSASGAYAGYVWYHSEPIFASDCSVARSKDETKVLTKFLFEVLKVKQQTLYDLQQGSGQPHIYPSDIKKITIPLPNLTKQQKIVAHIQHLRAQVKQLETEANQALTEANQTIEQMILGSE